MSKELEALENIVNEYEQAVFHISYYATDEFTIKNDVDLLRKSLTPPTAEEVCEALSKEYGMEIIYSNNNFLIYNGRSMVIKFDSGILFRCDTLEPKTITLIGRFYEGLK